MSTCYAWLKSCARPLVVAVVQRAARRNGDCGAVPSLRAALRIYPLIKAPDERNRPPDGLLVTAALSPGEGGPEHQPVNDRRLWHWSATKLRERRDLSADATIQEWVYDLWAGDARGR